MWWRSREAYLASEVGECAKFMKFNGNDVAGEGFLYDS